MAPVQTWLAGTGRSGLTNFGRQGVKVSLLFAPDGSKAAGSSLLQRWQRCGSAALQCGLGKHAGCHKALKHPLRVAPLEVRHCTRNFVSSSTQHSRSTSSSAAETCTSLLEQCGRTCCRWNHCSNLAESLIVHPRRRHALATFFRGLQGHGCTTNLGCV